MTFDYPLVLFGLTVLIPLFISDIVRSRKRQKLSGELERKLLASVLLFRLFIIFAITGLAGPRWGMSYVLTEYRRGLDIVFAVDISRSMDIHDTPTGQSRLERGLAIARSTLASVSGARYAAAIGRGSGYLAVPLTYDSEAAAVFLESIDALSITGRSTNLESLVEAAANAFQDTSPARKVIVLISDGESHAGILRNAVNRCAREGIMINTVAVGSDEGRQIPANSGGQQLASGILNTDVEFVVSRRDALAMRTAAERTGGIYIDGNRTDAINELTSHLLSMAQDTETEQGNGRQEPKQQRSFFIILALAAYGASKFVTRQLRRQKLSLLPFASIVLASIFFSSCSEGKLTLMEANYLSSRGRYDEALTPYLKALNHESAAPYAEYGLGLVFYMLDKGDAALQRYNDSRKLLEKYTDSEHRELRYRNHYNTGIIFFEEGDYHSAADSFKEALRANPKRIEAKRNLELSIMSISMESRMNNRTENQQEQREILFEYLKQEEQQLWKSREWAPDENNTGPDY
ncbi:MAG: VWA domain-containing protein [Treponema sp.]|nr:VWA domain-containing protein [Treponema sp.]